MRRRMTVAVVFLMVLLMAALGLGLWLRGGTENSRDAVPPAAPSVPVPPPAPKPRPAEAPIPAEILDGRILPSQSTHLVRLPDALANKATFVHRDALEDLNALMAAAQRDNIPLKVVSGFRSYWHQKNIWDKKWQQYAREIPDETARVEKLTQFSAVPGVSRHHWGTDVDFNSVETAYWHSAEGQKVWQWLRQNAHRYGFCQVYDGRAQGQRSGGHEDEAWHWSHLPSAEPLHRQRSARLHEALYPDLAGHAVLQQKPELVRPFVDSLAPECVPR